MTDRQHRGAELSDVDTAAAFAEWATAPPAVQRYVAMTAYLDIACGLAVVLDETTQEHSTDMFRIGLDPVARRLSGIDIDDHSVSPGDGYTLAGKIMSDIPLEGRTGSRRQKEGQLISQCAQAQTAMLKIFVEHGGQL